MTMERGSDKHSPLVDDALKDELRPLEQGAPVDPRAQEGRQQEAPDDWEPVPDARTAEAGAGSALGTDTEEERRELARALPPSIFPADRTALVEAARAANARAPVVDALEQLPDGRTFAGIAEVWETLG
jgi:hypothetical protein